MASKRLTLIEPLCVGDEHAKFNFMITSAVLDVTRKEPTVTFIGEEKHCAALQSKLDKDHLRTIAFVPVARRGIWKSSRAWKIKLLGIALFMSWVKPPAKHIFLSANTPVLLLSVLFRGADKHSFILHTYFAQFMQRISRTKTMSDRLLIRVAGMGRLVLLRGDLPCIALAAFPKLDLVAVEHPIEIAPKPRSALPGSAPLRIGFIGRATVEKGFHLFQELATELRSEAIIFEHIGPAGSGSSLQMLNGEEYQRRISGLDFIFYGNINDAYRYVASGTLFDAIGSGIPLIGIRDSLISHLEKTFGPVGLFCGDVTSLVAALKQLALTPSVASRSGVRQLVSTCRYDGHEFRNAVRRAFLL